MFARMTTFLSHEETIIAIRLFASVLGAASYLLMADALSVIWPRWLLLLGLCLIVVALFAQKGLWGLIEKLAGLFSDKQAEKGLADDQTSSAAATAKEG